MSIRRSRPVEKKVQLAEAVAHLVDVVARRRLDSLDAAVERYVESFNGRYPEREWTSGSQPMFRVSPTGGGRYPSIYLAEEPLARSLALLLSRFHPFGPAAVFRFDPLTKATDLILYASDGIAGSCGEACVDKLEGRNHLDAGVPRGGSSMETIQHLRPARLQRDDDGRHVGTGAEGVAMLLDDGEPAAPALGVRLSDPLVELHILGLRAGPQKLRRQAYLSKSQLVEAGLR
ncbi:MAG: hypothetical protein H0V84_01420 [Actinobacteria bacterium]|nr:hypothetical protein [Actinomycetota bacterium]